MLRNIDPQAAQLTSDVLDRILYLKQGIGISSDISSSLAEKSITVVKRLLADYQPTWAKSIALQEGKRKKGGHNDFPSTPRPASPSGQGGKK